MIDERIVREKIAHILEQMQGFGQIAVALSGGVDSSVVAALAREALGDRAIAVTAVSETLASRELDEAVEVAREIGIEHVRVAFSELSDERFVQNTPSRCFFCQTMRFGELRAMAQRLGVETIASGSNASDLGEHRPGLEAMNSQCVYQPLLEHEITKEQVRWIARDRGLSVWDKPAKACLSSRIPHGTQVTEARLRRIERAEEVLVAPIGEGGLGLKQVRVRDHGGIARVEIASDEIERVWSAKTLRDLCERIKAAGFDHVTLDLVGYRAGSLSPA